MSETKKPEWEEVASDTFRIVVPGGWLYANRENDTFAFVPDPAARDAERVAYERDAARHEERMRCVRIIRDRIDGGTDAGKHLGDGDLSEMIREIEGRTR